MKFFGDRIRKAVTYLTVAALLNSLMSPLFSVAAQPIGREASGLAPPNGEANLLGRPVSLSLDGGPQSIEAFLPDLFTGQIRHEIPISVPLTKPLVAFKIAPLYSLGTNGELGANWSLGIPSIRMDTIWGKL